MKTRIARQLATATVAGLAFSLAACSDAPVDPASSTNALKPEGAHLTLASTSVTTATLYPQYDNVYVSVEGHRIVIPAYSICAVGVSGYAPGLWDKACAPETSPIVFTITTSIDTDGSSRLSVKPDVRFVPDKRVMAYFKDPKGSVTPGSYIAYCFANGCKDEGKADASMTTYRDATQGIIYRRLKHFSGYNVVFGFGGGSESSLLRSLPPSFLKSGYITTVGFDGGDAQGSDSRFHQ